MRIFLTGANGFIGGSVATTLIAAGHRVRGLVRNKAKADVVATHGIEAVIGSLDDAGILQDEARAADAVINTASSDHRGAVETLIGALSGSGKALIHSSGSSIVADIAMGEPLADKAAADYKAKKEGPIILVGHSLGADAVMEMADYLGDKGVPVALVIPFDGTQSFPAPGNVGRVVNFTQRDYAYMRPGLGFRGSLSNVDLSGDHDINHLNIDKSPDLHARVIKEVLAIVGGRRMTAPVPARPASVSAPDERTTSHAPANMGEADAGGEPKNFAPPVSSPPPRKPASSPQPINPAQIPN
jgi:hypothetical protein